MSRICPAEYCIGGNVREWLQKFAGQTGSLSMHRVKLTKPVKDFLRTHPGLGAFAFPPLRIEDPDWMHRAFNRVQKDYTLVMRPN